MLPMIQSFDNPDRDIVFPLLRLRVSNLGTKFGILHRIYAPTAMTATGTKFAKHGHSRESFKPTFLIWPVTQYSGPAAGTVFPI
jgi:hypothetical protein